MPRPEWNYKGNCKNCVKHGKCNTPCEPAKRNVTMRAAQIYNSMLTEGVDTYLRNHGGLK